MKINVVGTSGSGKSLLSRRISHALSLPYIELDALFWLPKWTSTPDSQFLSKIHTALTTASDQAGGWVLDGNYNRTRPIKWAEVDMVVWVDYPFWRTMWQALKRAIGRIWSGRELWPGTGNRERWTETFCSRNSILLWTVMTFRSNRRRYAADMRDRAYEHIRFVRVRSDAEADRLIREMEGMNRG